MSDLRECPFCGGEGEYFGEALMGTIRCKSCGAGSYGVGHEWLNSIEEHWNTREADKEINQLKAQVERLRKACKMALMEAEYGSGDHFAAPAACCDIERIIHEALEGKPK